jgi:hypothetical protein
MKENHGSYEKLGCHLIYKQSSKTGRKWLDEGFMLVLVFVAIKHVRLQDFSSREGQWCRATRGV